MKGAEIGVLEKRDQVSFRRFLQCAKSRALESHSYLHFIRDLADKPLKGQLLDQELCCLLEPTDLAKGNLQDTNTGSKDSSEMVSNSAGTPTLRLLDASRCGGRFAGGLGRDHQARFLATFSLASSLLGAGHSAMGETCKATAEV